MPPPPSATDYDVEAVRRQFPALQQSVHGKPLVYLDSAATSQKPQAVLDAITRFYAVDCANVHRGLHALSERATAAYEGARDVVRRYLNAADAREIVFTSGTTGAINLVAHAFGGQLARGDEIVLTGMEHHSNIVPWQLLRDRIGIVLRIAPITDAGELDMDAFGRLLGDRTRLVACVHVSNALGTVNPAAEIVRLAHARGIPVLLDGAQAVPHGPVDVRALDADFYAFSGHKAYGPTGIGVLYGKAARLEAMPPFLGGGDMIRSVAFERTTYAAPPARFEAGTPHIAGAIGLGAALAWLTALGPARVAAHEADLLAYATARLATIRDLRLIGTARHKAAVVSFVLGDVHPHDIGTVLDTEGIAIRAGHHCAQPLMERFGVPATARASFAAYNTRAEVDALVAGLQKVREVFRL